MEENIRFIYKNLISRLLNITLSGAVNTYQTNTKISTAWGYVCTQRLDFMTQHSDKSNKEQNYSGHVALDHTTQGNFLDDPISKINALIASVPV